MRENKQKGRKGERDVGGKKIGTEDGEAGGQCVVGEGWAGLDAGGG